MWIDWRDRTDTLVVPAFFTVTLKIYLAIVLVYCGMAEAYLDEEHLAKTASVIGVCSLVKGVINLL